MKNSNFLLTKMFLWIIQKKFSLIESKSILLSRDSNSLWNQIFVFFYLIWEIVFLFSETKGKYINQIPYTSASNRKSRIKYFSDIKTLLSLKLLFVNIFCGLKREERIQTENKKKKTILKNSHSFRNWVHFQRESNKEV